VFSPDQAKFLDAVTAGAAAARATGKGGVVFVSGAPGSGRSFALRRAEESLARLDWLRIVSRTPHGQVGRAVAGEEPLPMDDLVAGAASGVSLCNPALAFVGPLVRLSLAAKRLVESLQARGTEIEVTDLFARLLRAASSQDDKPLVCLVDEADDLDGTWWTNLQWTFAQEIRERQPLLLVLVVDGPAQLDSDPPEDESAGCAAARSLVGRELANWHGFRPVGQEDVVAWLGPAPSSLLSPALQISGGRAGELAALWALWQQAGAIRRDEDRGWRLEKPQEVLVHVADELSERLEAMLGPGDRSRQEKLRQLLSCGALEGRTFTARAMADVFGWDHDEVIDLLDELVEEERPERGVLLDLGAIEVPDLTRNEKRVLWRYRFVSHLHWRAARDLLAGEAEREAMAARLVQALCAAYDPDNQAIAHVLASLCRLAGEREAAAMWRSVALSASQEVRRGCAKHLLGIDTAGWTIWDYRDATRLLLEAAEHLLITDPPSFVTGIAKRAEAFARLADPAAPGAEAHAICLQGSMLRFSGRLVPARERLVLARGLSAHGAPMTLARCLTQQGSLERMRGDFDAAKRLIGKADGIYSRTGHPSGRATCAYLATSIEYEAENYVAAERCLEAGLRFGEEEALDGLAIALMRLVALIESTCNDADAARAHGLQSLEWARTAGYVHEEGSCHWVMGVVELDQGAFESAFSFASHALELQLRLGDREGEARSELTRGRAARELADRETARASLMRSAAIYSQFGNAMRADAIGRELAAF